MAADLQTSFSSSPSSPIPPRPRREPAFAAESGIILPNIHLGSFSRMTLDLDDGRYPRPYSTAGRRTVSAIETNGLPLAQELEGEIPRGPHQGVDPSPQDVNSASLSGRQVYTPATSLPSSGVSPVVKRSGERQTGDSQSPRPTAFDVNGVPLPDVRDSAILLNETHLGSPTAPILQQAPERRVVENGAPLQNGSTPELPPAPSARLPRPKPPTVPSPDGFGYPANSRPYPGSPFYPSSAPNMGIPGKVVPPEEICLECMARDRDMADVDVRSPGVWDRDSDVWYQELLKRDEEEGSDQTAVTGMSRNKPSARGDWLTEDNLALWLKLNPKESAGRWATLEQYLKTQYALLQAEREAQDEARREAQRFDLQLRDSYSELRRSGADFASSKGDHPSGLRIKHPRTASDVTVFENGLVREKVNVRQEEKEMDQRRRRQERSDRQRSRGMSTLSTRGQSQDTLSLYSAPAQRGDYGIHSVSSQHSLALSASPTYNRPMSQPFLNPSSPRPSFNRQSSQVSIETRRTRFLGFRQSSGAWASDASIAESRGSMFPLHMGFDEKELPVLPDEFGNFSASPLRTSPIGLEIEDGPPHDNRTTRSKKKKGIGKIWKLFTGQKKSNEETDRPADRFGTDDDLSAPLDPPPSIKDLVNRPNMIGRGTSHSRHGSALSLPSPSHPRSASAPAQSITGVSPPTAPSSILPSPTSNRSSWRDSTGDGRRGSIPMDDTDHPEEARKTLDVPPPHPDPRALTTVTAHASPASTVLAVTPRPPTLYKALPPLPPSMTNSQPTRPFTINVDSFPHNSSALLSPAPPFAREQRRQSFGGSASRPQSMAPGTLPNTAGTGAHPGQAFSAQYGTFNTSRRSLRNLDDSSLSSRALDAPKKVTKRQSKFGNFSLFGRKSRDVSPSQDDNSWRGATFSPNAFDLPQEEFAYFPHDAQTDDQRHSLYSFPTAPTPSKRLAELIPQDDDFIAFRYPSAHQNVDLIRR